MKRGFEKPQQKRRAIDEFSVRWIGKLRNELRMQDAVEQRGNSEEKTHDGPRSANIKQRAIGAHGRTYHDERAKGAGEIGERNKKRIARINVVMTAGKVMSQFMRQKNC